MDLTKRKAFFLLLCISGMLLILLGNLLGFESTHQVFLVAANFHNSSLAYLSALNMNVSILPEIGDGLKNAVYKEHFLELNPQIPAFKTNDSALNLYLRYTQLGRKNNRRNRVNRYKSEQSKTGGDFDINYKNLGFEESADKEFIIEDDSVGNIEFDNGSKQKHLAGSNKIYKIIHYDGSRNVKSVKETTDFGRNARYQRFKNPKESRKHEFPNELLSTDSERNLNVQDVFDTYKRKQDQKNVLDTKENEAKSTFGETYGTVQMSQYGVNENSINISARAVYNQEEDGSAISEITDFMGESFTLDSVCVKRETRVEDILCLRRPEFLPDFRNPCWYQNEVLRCLPYFYIIGVCKTGTTDLFERISHHPRVIKNKGILGKETWFWTWLRYGHNNFHSTRTYRRSFDNFIDYFDADTIEKVTTRMTDGSMYHPLITGHGDPMDFWDQASWKLIPQNDPDLDLPNVTTPHLVKHVNPNVKLILLIRDPIERLFSNYLHGQFGLNSRHFHEDVVTSLKLLKSCRSTRSLKACLYDERLIKNLLVPISGSFYSIHLKEWLKVFPRKQMFITTTEDFSKNIPETLLKIFRFLQLDPLPTRDLYRIANMPHFYDTKAKHTAGEILDETRTLLESVFEPYNQELAEILNDPKYNYNNR